MIDYDSMGPSVQLTKARFLNSFLNKLSRDFKPCRMSILLDFSNGSIYLMLQSHGRVWC